MSIFTMRLHEVIGRGYDIGLRKEDYPIFDEEYREHLNRRIVDRYWNEEIGQETVEMFVFTLNRVMREIMPYYNALYESTRIDIDPALSMSVTEIIDTTDSRTASEDTAQTSTSLSNTSSKARTVNSDTPQMMLSGSGDYATSAQDTSSDADATSEASTGGQVSSMGSGEGRTERSQRGYTGSVAELIMKYRESILNVDLMVLAELEKCFMLVWNTGDQYTPGYVYGLYGGIY